RTPYCARSSKAPARASTGATWSRPSFSRSVCCPMSSRPITRIRPRGTRSALVVRQVPAAMSEWISIAATHGRPLRPRPKARVRPGETMLAFDDARLLPRGKNGRAPDPFRVGGWVPMREYRDDDAVDFAIVGTGAGGGTLACRLAEMGFSVVGFDAGPWWRP